MKKETILILHDIRSKINVGSIFRTADAVGVTKIYLTGYTPAPTDRFGRPVQEIAKSALGAELTIPWEKKKDPKSVLKKLKAENFSIIAVEQSKKSVDYKKVKPKFPAAFIFGNEVLGVSDSLLKLSDTIAEIPMKG
jgi:tRNA G18 (ribose-2'-O)-methylase SpoU